jgi:hypothetical protein
MLLKFKGRGSGEGGKETRSQGSRGTTIQVSSSIQTGPQFPTEASETEVGSCIGRGNEESDEEWVGEG